MVSIYQSTVPMMLRSTRNFKAILSKAESHCASKGIDPKTILSYRLIEDMRPLPYQVQSLSDTVKFMANRVCGTTHAPVEDNEETFEQLQARLDLTISILESLSPSSFEGDDNREVTMATARMGTYKFDVLSYIYGYAIPNFHFHLSSGYCILRTFGVPVSAFDYLGKDLFVKV